MYRRRRQQTRRHEAVMPEGWSFDAYTKKDTSTVAFHTPSLDRPGSLVLVVNQGTIRMAEVREMKSKRAVVRWSNSVRVMERSVTIVKNVSEWLFNPNQRGLLFAACGDKHPNALIDKRLTDAMPLLAMLAMNEAGATPEAPPSAPYDMVGNIIMYENGELDRDDTIELFSHLIRTGDAWKLQGSYGRMAQRFIDAGLISSNGTVNVARL